MTAVVRRSLVARSAASNRSPHAEADLHIGAFQQQEAFAGHGRGIGHTEVGDELRPPVEQLTLVRENDPPARVPRVAARPRR